ncbi:MAG: O-antigen ligase family protein [Cytophagales bacterium]|nr:O-antigen ligase family protein [Cytophagales bacterium]MDW8384064.1 O-antigen ligase family protein [Flammeovirgaceae bacterium]
MISPHILKRLITLSLILFVCTLPFHWRYNNIAIGLLAVTSLIQVRIQKLKNLISTPLFWILTAVFWTDILSCFFSENLQEALFLIEKRISILAMPLFIGVLTPEILDYEHIIQLLKAFAYSVFVALLICLISAAIKQNEIGWHELKKEAFMYHDLTEIIEVHSIYIAQYASFAIGIILYIFLYEPLSLSLKIFHGFISIFLYACLFLLANRITILAFHIIVLVLGIYLGYQKANLRMNVIIILSCMILGIYGTYHYNPFFKERTQEILISLRDPSQASGNTSTRLFILKCCKDLLLHQNTWIWGFGTGDSQQELNNCYNQYKQGKILTEDGKKNGPNAHNQYIQETLNKGIIGLAAWMSFLIVPVWYLFRRKDAFLDLYIIFWFGFATLSLTESPLDMNKGITYFSFFQSLFSLRKSSGL